jgi:hypothetical protein
VKTSYGGGDDNYDDKVVVVMMIMSAAMTSTTKRTKRFTGEESLIKLHYIVKFTNCDTCCTHLICQDNDI